MSDSKNVLNRRQIFKAGIAGLGVSTLYGLSSNLSAHSTHPNKIQSKQFHCDNALPREIWIATISHEDIWLETHQEMLNKMLKICKETRAFKPDIVCLPETFAFANILNKINLQAMVKFSYQEIMPRIQAFAKTNHCYVICPTYTQHQNKIFNAAVCIDREGEVTGEYQKILLTPEEINLGIEQGPSTPVIFKTDFGQVGVQICFDIDSDMGWEQLSKAQTDLVFWVTAFAGGQRLTTRTWQHNYPIVSSTWKGESRICDIAGEVVAATGRWNKNWICSALNLETMLIPAWPYAEKIPAIQQKYGRQIKITIYHEEEWIKLTSLTPVLKIKDLLTEFNMKTIN
ncbi:MAG: nitrilase-related carbon-nitrogen hydrolase [Pseudomonadota bacterium]